MDRGGEAEKVLVIGDDTRSGLAVIRSLGRAGKIVHVAPFSWRSPSLRSRYVHRVHRLPRYAEERHAWATELAAIVSREKINLVLPCCDRGLLLLAEHRDVLAHTALAIPSPAAIDILFDKARTRDLCSSLGVPVAVGRLLTPTDDAATLARELGLPLFIKPRRSYRVSDIGSRGKVRRAADLTELSAILQSIDDPEQYLAESAFEGTGGGLSVMARDGAVEHAFQHGRLREAILGGSSLRVSEPVDPERLAAVEAICKATRLTGVCMFETLHDPVSGRWIIVEANARFWGSLPLPVALGVDFPLFLHDAIVSRRSHPQVAYSEGVVGRNLVHDGFNLMQAFASGKHRMATLRSLFSFCAQPLFWALGLERSDTFVRDDPLPALFELLSLPRTIRDKQALQGLGSRERRRPARQPMDEVAATS